MTSETEGWASGTSLLHTRDGGRTWLDVLPLSQRNTWTALGAGQAWAATTAPDERQILVHRTADSGKTWETTPVPLPAGMAPGASPVSISFADAAHGWLMIEPMRSMNSHPGYLYATADGGKTWKPAASTDDTLPVGGLIRLEPGRPDEGWLVGNQVSTTPKDLYRTTDGGRTWERQELKLPPNRLEPGQIDYDLPVISPEGREGLLTAAWVPDSGAAAAYATLLFRTSDGGTTWDHLGAYLPPGVVGTYDGAQAWVWIGIPREPGSTTIVSGSWSVKSAPWSVGKAMEPDATLVTALEEGWNITALQFVTYSAGWALLTKQGDDPRLLQTKDAGQTWTRVN
jgi:photosystem II stability/assembly factor-like uncharacterized protein